MVNSSLLQQIVKNLEQHEKALRIKKLIYCLSKNAWENDPNKLKNISLQDLVLELRKKHPTLEHLKYSLARVVKTLNKPEEYAVVAKVIFGNVGRLYPEFQKLIQSNKPASPVQPANQNLSNTKEKSKAADAGAMQEKRKAYEPFAVRMEVMNYTNPLRAKIVLFSTLYQPFDFSNQSWLSLRTYALDDLLQSLYSACKTITDLDFQLQKTAKSLKEPNENIKAAWAIVQSLKPYYPEPSVNQTQSVADDEEITTLNPNAESQLNPAGVIYDDDDHTCQFLPS